jgi:hypothetical protein
VWQVDLALMQMLPELALRAKAVSIREGYRKIVSARRTKSFNDIAASHSDPVVRLTRIENGKTGLHLSLITGSVFAVVLYLFFE